MNQTILTNLEKLKGKITKIEESISKLNKNAGVNLEEEIESLNDYVDSRITVIEDKVKNIDSSFVVTEENSNSNFLVEYAGNWIKDFAERLKNANDSETSSYAREMRSFQLQMYSKGYYLKEYEDIIRKIYNEINSKLVEAQNSREKKGKEFENQKKDDKVKQPVVSENEYPTPQVARKR